MRDSGCAYACFRVPHLLYLGIERMGCRRGSIVYVADGAVGLEERVHMYKRNSNIGWRDHPLY